MASLALIPNPNYQEFQLAYVDLLDLDLLTSLTFRVRPSGIRPNDWIPNSPLGYVDMVSFSRTFEYAWKSRPLHFLLYTIKKKIICGTFFFFRTRQNTCGVHSKEVTFDTQKYAPCEQRRAVPIEINGKCIVGMVVRILAQNTCVLRAKIHT